MIPTLVMVEVWHWTPLVALIVLGGPAALPVEPYDAAKLPRYGYGLRLGPDQMVPEELRLRALYAVRWNGEIARSGPYEDEVWAQIAALQGGDPGLIEKYKMMDPDFVGFALLVGLLDCVKYDGFLGAQKRQGYIGVTLASWAEEQANIMRGNPLPSGNE